MDAGARTKRKNGHIPFVILFLKIKYVLYLYRNVSLRLV